MKKNYFTMKLILAIAIFSFSQNTSAQCLVNYDLNGTNVITANPFLWGQGFIAECDGNLEYVQFTSNEVGNVSAGTLKIYSGNTVSNSPIYTQSHPIIVINQINEPIRVNITGSVEVVQDAQYTFEFTVDNLDILADFANGYAGGSAFQDGNEAASADFIFAVSILDPSASLNELTDYSQISLYPNPSNDFIMISNFKGTEKYTIVNTLGNEIEEGSVSEGEKIDISNFTNGLYFLKFENGNAIKFVKK